MIITMQDVRNVNYCSRGTRLFFSQRGWDWTEFLKNGIDAQLLIDTGDAQAIKVVEVARGQ